MQEIRTTDKGVELVRSWASDIDDRAMGQAMASARSEAVSGPVALMPDAHVGMGATVGSVIPTESAIIPAAVGVDIGCGMIAVETTLRADDLPDDLSGILRGIEEAIPAGFGRFQEPTRAAGRWYVNHPAPHPKDLSTKQHRKVPQQLGTLGGGNHFVEVSLDERDTVWCVLHSGSRGIGNELATGHIRAAKSLCQALERRVEDRDLAYFLDTDEEFTAYIADMGWAQDYALKNRELMMDALLGVFGREMGVRVVEVERINCHHNYTARETHDGHELWITRKGAIRASVGTRGVIPGSMGTSTYIVTGKGDPLSYESASHGAGRRRSRTAARKEFTTDQLDEAMGGRTWQAGQARKLLDEAPMAYKDIGRVMADQADLVTVDHVLNAVVNFKGT
jgi:RNA-splicing ligase RtcB